MKSELKLGSQRKGQGNHVSHWRLQRMCHYRQGLQQTLKNRKVTEYFQQSVWGMKAWLVWRTVSMCRVQNEIRWVGKARIKSIPESRGGARA